MKVLAINGSPHSDGVVAKGISIMIGELAKENIETEIIHAGNKKIQGCIACRKCIGTQQCAIPGDIVQETSEKMRAADGLILGSPTYFGSIAGTFKCLLDRLFFCYPNMRYKVGAAVVSLRRAGGVGVFHQLNNYFNLSQIIITPGMYWDVIYGNNAQEVLGDMEGLQLMEVQGRNMAWLIKAVAARKEETPIPEPPAERIRTNFIR